MDIFQFAMKMEKDGETHYRKLIERTQNPGLQKILTMLANEEVKHYQIIEQMSKNASVKTTSETKILENAKNIFIQMGESKQDILSAEGEIDLYKKAKQIEKASRIFYTEKAGAAEDDQLKQTLLILAEEEQQHEFLIDNLIEFISRPNTWLENAEWHHLDEY